MGSVKENKQLRGSSGQLFDRGLYDEYQQNLSARNNALSKLGNVGVITSRDDIINPYDLINPSMYKSTRAGKAQYESDLASLIELQKQQNASYEEWYNSEEQQAIRQRAAGINPDLNGVENSAAAEVEASDVVPGAELPTDGQVATQAIGSVAAILGTVVSSVATLGTLPATIAASLAGAGAATAAAAASKAAETGQNIANTAALGTAVGDEIGQLYAAASQAALDAGEDFDSEAWFAHDPNFDGVREIFGEYPNFDAVLANERSKLLTHKRNAAKLKKEWASDQMDFGFIYSDPLFSPSEKIMIPQQAELQGYFRDCEQAILKYKKTEAEIDEEIKRGLDVKTAIDAANAQNEYLANIDGRKKAAQEELLRDFEVARFRRQHRMHEHLFKVFDDDPVSLSAGAATYMIGGMAPQQYGEFMAAYGVAYASQLFPNDSPSIPYKVDKNNPFMPGYVNPTERMLRDAGINVPSGFSFGD